MAKKERKLFSDRHKGKNDEDLNITIDGNACSELESIFSGFYIEDQKDEPSNERKVWVEIAQKYGLTGKPEVARKIIELQSVIAIFDLIESWSFHTNKDGFGKAINQLFFEHGIEWQLTNGIIVNNEEQEKAEFDFRRFLETARSYEKFKIDGTTDFSTARYLGATIETFCDKCGKNRPFKSGKVAFQTYRSHIPMTKEDEKERMTEHFIGILFECGGCENTNMAHGKGERFIALRITPNLIEKVGQYPSAVKQYEWKYQRYEKDLKRYYGELLEASFSYSTGQGIGAFVYLRRILEHLVNTKYKTLTVQNPQADFIERMKAVDEAEKIIPDELTSERNQLYRVLSKGVHEYDDDECLRLYECAVYVIELILERELEKRERAARVKEVKKAFNAENARSAENATQ